MMSSARMQPMANMSTGGPYLLARSSTSGARYLHSQASKIARDVLEETYLAWMADTAARHGHVMW